MLPSGAVGGCSWTVALGKVGVVPGRLGDPGGLSAPVPIGAAEVASLMVGAGAPAVGGPAVRRGIVGAGAPLAVGGPAVRRGMVGAGAGGRGAPDGAVGVGGPPGTGGRTGGASGTVAEGTAGGASAAFNVTRTVSFLRGTLDVCLEGLGDWFSLSLMRARGFVKVALRAE